MSQRHQLKTWPDQFAAIRSGAKTFEIRWNDRVYAPGDVLQLHEFDPVRSTFTGEAETREVTHVTGEAEVKFFGLAAGYVVCGLKAPPPAPREASPADYNDLIAWHAELAVSASTRAANWRRAAQLHPTSATRYLAAADMAEAEAAQHAGAVALIRSLVDAVRRLVSPETPRG